MKKMMKIAGILLCSGLLMSCQSSGDREGEDEKEQVLTVRELKSSDKVTEYFNAKDVVIKEMELDKRQTNEEDKEDIAYVEVVAENDTVSLTGVYVVVSNYYDVGGWQVEDVYPDGAVTWSVIRIPDFDLYEADDGYTYSILSKEKTDENRYKITYSRECEGSAASISETRESEYEFSTTTGEWKFVSGSKLDYHVELEEISDVYIWESAKDVENPTKFYLFSYKDEGEVYLFLELYKYDDGRYSASSTAAKGYKSYTKGFAELEEYYGMYYYKFEDGSSDYYVIVQPDALYCKHFNWGNASFSYPEEDERLCIYEG